MHISCITENAFSSGSRLTVQSLQPEATAAADPEHLLTHSDYATRVFGAERGAEVMATGSGLGIGEVCGQDRAGRMGGASSTNPPVFVGCNA